MKAEVNIGKGIMDKQLQQIKRDDGAEQKKSQGKFLPEGPKQQQAGLFPNGFFHV